MNARYLALPAVGAAIGWFTNYLAVKMLFLPRRPWKFVGFNVQGLVPRRRAELAGSIAEVVERELFSIEDVQAVMADPAYLRRLRDRLNDRVDAFLSGKARQSHWFVGLVLEGDAVGRLKDGLLDAFLAALPALAEDFAGELENHVDIRRIIVEKIETLDLVRLEKMVYRIARQELRHIELLGGVLGFVIGAAELILLCLID